MPLNPDAQRFLRALATIRGAETSRVSVEQRRRSFHGLMGFSAGGAAEQIPEETTIAGSDGSIRMRRYRPAIPPPARSSGLVYFHGGGFVAGSLDTHHALCLALSSALQCHLFAVDYRLAPEHKFPAPLRDAHDATRWVLQNAKELGVEPERIAVGGDSAGATLAAVVCHLMKPQRDVRLAYQLLLCPITDFAADTASRRLFAADPLAGEAVRRSDLACYLPSSVAPTDPLVSPLRTRDCSELPPAYVHTAEFDPMRDEGESYAQQLAAAGVPVHYTCHPGMIHMFYALNRVIAYADPAIAAIGQEIRATQPPA